MCNRPLGFVNAPAVGQKILLESLGSEVDLNVYRARRDAMVDVLDAAGLQYTRPQGAFYVFAKSPVSDENALVNALLAERILAVPGRGFGRSGYIRLAFCVDETIIRRSKEGFVRAVKSLQA
jgi:aspartate aminotransferase